MENNKKRIIGRFTFGFALILFGISLVIQTLCSTDILRYILMLWPLVFISIGIEILYYSYKENIETKYDFPGIILTGLIVFFGIIFSFINYGVNKILYSDTIQTYISSQKDDFVDYYFDSDIKIINCSDKNIKMKINEEPNYNGVKAIIKYTIKPDTSSNLIAYIKNDYSIYKYLDISNLNQDVANLEILDIPDAYETLEIVITTNSKNRVQTSGNFNNF